MTEREQERAAVVAWLEETAKAQMRVCENNAKFHNYEIAAKAQQQHALYQALAEAVSRCDHLETKP